jgi:hypothetical protein
MLIKIINEKLEMYTLTFVLGSLFFMFFLIFCEAAAGTILAPYYNVRLKCPIGD